MKFGFPWSAKEIPPQARATAEEAARRAGMSLGDWLNSVITRQAAHAGEQSPPRRRFRFPPRPSCRGERSDRRSGEAHRKACAHQAPPPTRLKRIRDAANRPTDELPPPPAGMPSVPLPPSIDRFIAEIATRQRMLGNDESRAGHRSAGNLPAAAPAPPLQPAQDLSGLENQLRNITRSDRDPAQTGRRTGHQCVARGTRRDRPHAQRGDAPPCARSHRKPNPRARPAHRRRPPGRHRRRRARRHRARPCRGARRDARTDAGGKPDRLTPTR